MSAYGIGLDIGITSVGWAVLDLDQNDRPYRIRDMGSRIFDAAEHPKTGASLAAPRREARSARRRLRRHRHRNERIRNLIVGSGLLSQDELDHLFEGKLPDIYELRVRALDAPVTRKEFARILIHLSQRRGFRSNRKGGAGNEDGKLLEAVMENKQRMAQYGYRTPAEMLLRDPAFSEHKRNKGGQYITTVTRDMIADEARAIFAGQRKCGSDFAGEGLEEQYLTILLSQRSFDEGPGGNSPYSGQIENRVGLCTFEPDQPRAAKATYSFEYFTLLQKINHIRIQQGGNSTPLTAEQRRQLIELAHKKDSLDFFKLRKELNLTDEQSFNIFYRQNDTREETEKKEKFNFLRAYHQIRKALDKVSKGRIALLTRDQLNVIGTVLTLYKTSEKIRPKLTDAGLEEKDIDALEALSFSGFGHLSAKACDKIIPGLEKGLTYNEACTEAGYNFRGHQNEEKTRLLPPLDPGQNEITSPVVLRSISQTIKVINAIIRKMDCSPVYINIELAREMSKDFSERHKIKRDQDENQARNDRIMERIRTDYGKLNPTGQDLVKLKLYEEQGGICPYSQKMISAERLFEPNYVEVDHIVPYSISFDDSYKNKVLVFAEENRNKGNRLPLQYLKGQRRNDYMVWVKNSVRDQKKQRLLLKEAFTEEDEASFKQRNLQDTQTATRFILNHVQDHLQFEPFSSGQKRHVTAVNGAVTSYMRKRWGITKLREDGDLHHAVDALVIACTTPGMIQQISRYSIYRECQYMQDGGTSLAVDPATGEVLKEFPHPWPHFRRELEARLANDPQRVITDLKLPTYRTEGAPEVKPIFVSRMPQRKVTGAAHKDTVKSAKALADGYVIVRRPLTMLKLDKTGEIAGYYNPASDRLLYEALKARLAEFGGDGAKAFREPFYKPKHDGMPGPLVSKVKLCEPSTLNVAVQEGTAVADNDSMIRIDVFHVPGEGYYYVPIYVADTLKPTLPNRASVPRKPYDEWKEMSDKDFCFSLYPNDLIRVTSKKGVSLSLAFEESTLPTVYQSKNVLLYYKGAGINTASISCITHDNTYIKESLGIKTLEKLEKYTVDILGEYHPVSKEPRLGFSDMRR